MSYLTWNWQVPLLDPKIWSLAALIDTLELAKLGE